MSKKITSRDIAKMLNVVDEYDDLVLESQIQAAYDVVMGDIEDDSDNNCTNENKC